jgi:hypothetical protein
MELPEIKEGVTIKALKEDIRLEGIEPSKDGYLVHLDSNKWAGIGWCNSGSNKFKTEWCLPRYILEKYFDKGDISVHYPIVDPSNYILAEGDVFMNMLDGKCYVFSKMDSSLCVFDGTTNKQDYWLMDPGFFRDEHLNNKLRLVDGPSMYHFGVDNAATSVEPLNNGSRVKCWWCQKETVSMNTGFPGSSGMMCPNCGK